MVQRQVVIWLCQVVLPPSHQNVCLDEHFFFSIGSPGGEEQSIGSPRRSCLPSRLPSHLPSCQKPLTTGDLGELSPPHTGGIAVTSVSPSRAILTPFRAKPPQHYYEKIDQHMKLYRDLDLLQLFRSGSELRKLGSLSDISPSFAYQETPFRHYEGIPKNCFSKYTIKWRNWRLTAHCSLFETRTLMSPECSKSPLDRRGQCLQKW